MAAEQDDAHDRGQHDPELRFDQRGNHGCHSGTFRVAAHQRTDAEQDDEGTHGIGLTPHGRVVPGDRVEQVQRGGDQSQARRVGALGGPAPDQPVEQRGDEDVEYDRTQLEQVRARIVGPQQEGEQVTPQPQDVQVAGRVVGEESLGVELARPQPVQSIVPTPSTSRGPIRSRSRAAGRMR